MTRTNFGKRAKDVMSDVKRMQDIVLGYEKKDPIFISIVILIIAWFRSTEMKVNLMEWKK